MSLQSEFAGIAARDGRAALVTVIAGDSWARSCSSAPTAARTAASAAPSSTARASTRPRSCSGPSAPRRATCGDTSLFVDVIAPAPRLVIFGAVDYAAALCRLARAAGWRPFVCDPRSQFATPARFPDAEEVIVAWPEEAFARLGGIDRATYIAVLTHDPKLDDAALTIALRSDAAYVGAMGSRRAQAQRRERLLAAGLERGAARAHRGADRPRPGRREPRGDGAVDHGRGRGGAERARRRPPLARRRADPRGGRVIGGLVLAAGAGTRFGGRKQLAELDGRPLLEHALRAMTAAPVGRVVVVLGALVGGGHRDRGPARRRAVLVRALGRGPVGLAGLRPRGAGRLRGGRGHARRPAAHVARRDPARDRRARRRRRRRARDLLGRARPSRCCSSASCSSRSAT